MNVTDVMLYEVEPSPSAESLAAFNSIRPMEEKIFDAILSDFENADDSGLTAFECAERLGMFHQSVSTAASKLVKRKQLERTAYVRRNSSGRDGRVLALAGLAFTPRKDDKHSPEEVKQKAPKEVAACVSLAAAIKDMKAEGRGAELFMLKAELQRIVETI